jgi:predicted lipoprotein with Yx(FWY)xxD motif
MNRLDRQTKLSIRMKRVLAIAGVTASLAFAACGGDDDSDTTSGAPAAEGAADGGAGGSEATKQEGSGGAAKEQGSGTEIVATQSGEFGSILFDSEQQAIYLFDKESSETSECYGACAEAWPPVLTQGDPRAGEGLDAKLLGTTKRDDGSTQVTYGGHPLYYYVDDPPGQVLCHNVEEFGGLWLVVEPGGDAVQ